MTGPDFILTEEIRPIPRKRARAALRRAPEATASARPTGTPDQN